MIVTSAFWHIAYWLRFEQETGTLEAVYSRRPAARHWRRAWRCTAVRGVIERVGVSDRLPRVPGQTHSTARCCLAFLFVLFRLIPAVRRALLFGAVVLKVKESNALIGLMVGGRLLDGHLLPGAVLPTLVQTLAKASSR
jgi:hypothetical protein